MTAASDTRRWREAQRARERSAIGRIVPGIVPWLAVALAMSVLLNGYLFAHVMFQGEQSNVTPGTAETSAGAYVAIIDKRRLSSLPDESAGHQQHQQDALIFMFIAIMTGTGILHLSMTKTFANVQLTVAIFVVGLMFSLLAEGANMKKHIGRFGGSYEMWMAIDPHLLLFTMLPALLTGDAMCIDTCVAKRVGKQCLYLAGPGVLINALATAAFLKFLLMDWDFWLCLVTGSILCATDPVAVVALLKDLGAAPTLTIQIQGESLLNDGTAIVLFTIANDILKGVDYAPEDVVVFLVMVCCMAVLLGLFIGYVFVLWIAAASNMFDHRSSMIQISLTLCCAYVSFVIAEGIFHISGVLSTVSAALVLAHNMWPFVVSRDAMEHVWHTFEFIGNAIIFLLAGALIGKVLVDTVWADWLRLVAIYFFLVVARAALIFGSRPVLRLLSTDGQPVSIKDATVMTWGGLRGAIGLALAIQVYNERDEGHITAMMGKRVLFYVGGVAMLTLLVNAVTAPSLVKVLGITLSIAAKQKLLLKIHHQLVHHSEVNQHPPVVTEGIKRMLDVAAHHIRAAPTRQMSRGMSLELLSTSTIVPTFSDSARGHSLNGNKFERRDIIESFYEARKAFKELSPDQLQKLNEDMVHLSTAIDEDTEQDDLVRILCDAECDVAVTKAVNETFLTLVRHHYWVQINEGMLPPVSDASQVLLSSIQFSQGYKSDLMDFSFLMNFMRRFVNVQQHFVNGKTVTSYKPDRQSTPDPKLEIRNLSNLSTKAATIAHSTWFCLMLTIVITLNGVAVILESRYHKDGKNDLLWSVIEMAFITFFVGEFLVMIAYRRLMYFKDAWNLYDFTMILLGVFGVVTAFAVTGGSGSGAGVLRVMKMFRIMRLLRLVRLYKFVTMAKARLQRSQYSAAAADHMHVITVLRSFVIAHTSSQEVLIRFFGQPHDEDIGGDSVEDPEFARAILQSLTSVYNALVLAAMFSAEIDDEDLAHVNGAYQSRKVGRELHEFVMDALHNEVISSAQAESILHPIAEHIRKCEKLVTSSLEGRKGMRVTESTISNSSECGHSNSKLSLTAVISSVLFETNGSCSGHEDTDEQFADSKPRDSDMKITNEQHGKSGDSIAPHLAVDELPPGAINDESDVANTFFPAK